MIEFKTFAGLSELTEDGEFISAPAVMGNEDRDGDTIIPGAFTKSISEKSRLPVLDMHQLTRTVGLATASIEGNKMVARGRFNMKTISGREVYELAKQGAYGDWSIGYLIPKGKFETKWIGGKRHRRISEIALHEVSILPIGMAANPEAGTLALKMWNGGEVEIPDADPAEVKKVIEAYCSTMGIKSPFEKKSAEPGNHSEPGTGIIQPPTSGNLELARAISRFAENIKTKSYRPLFGAK